MYKYVNLLDEPLRLAFPESRLPQFMRKHAYQISPQNIARIDHIVVPMNKKEKQQQQPKKGGNKPAGEKGQQQQKSRPPKAPKVDHAEDVKREQKLQAILLADSFATAFRPITAEVPKVLLPLVNVPMLEYTLEFLSQSGVEEVTS